MHIYAHICTYTYIQYIYTHIIVTVVVIICITAPAGPSHQKYLTPTTFPPSVPQLWYHIKFCLACFGRTTVKYYDSS